MGEKGKWRLSRSHAQIQLRTSSIWLRLTSKILDTLQRSAATSPYRDLASSPAMQLTDLPYTIFLEIIGYLSPTDALVCRRISRDARRALTRSDLSISLILLHFPRSREGRQVQRYIKDDDRRALREASHWPDVFARLARRYFYLGNARPWRTTKISLLKDSVRLRGVTPWNRLLRLDQKTTPFHYWDPVWTFSSEDGLLVYPVVADIPAYHARDLDTGAEVVVPFEMRGKIIRRVRLCDRVLVFEWCEEDAYHPLNEQEAAHRHFATAFDVRRTISSSTPHRGLSVPTKAWAFTFRCEWKIHYLGLPLSHHDRFFSTHNRTHYAVYIWQPTRSPWGEDDPIERLIIWELGGPSTYRPSQDPNGMNKPEETGPRIIGRFINDELTAWGLRQKDTPSLRGLSLDNVTWNEDTQSACGHVFFTEEEHRWSAGPHSGANPPRLHSVKTTGLPLVGDGPRWVDACGGSDGGDAGTSFCWRGSRRQQSESAGTETWPGYAPCWRHDDFPYLTVSEVYDAAAGVRFSARQCFMLETLSVHIRPRLRVQRSQGRKPSLSVTESEGSIEECAPGVTRAEGPDGEEVQFADDTWDELLGKGVICGDERWLVGEDGEGDVTVLEF